MERKQFTFYESFAKSISRIRKAADRCAAYDALVNYALYGAEPNIDELPDAVALFFEMAKPTLDSSKRKAENGRRGGKAEANAERGESESKPEANGKQNASEKEKENEKEGEKEKEVENECSIPPSPSGANTKSKTPLTPAKRESMITEALAGHGEELLQVTRAWTAYKIEKQQGYQETGFKSLLSQIASSAQQYGDDAVVDVIRQSMSSNYQGIMFDRLRAQTGRRMSKTEEFVSAGRNHQRPPGELDRLVAGLERL